MIVFWFLFTNFAAPADAGGIDVGTVPRIVAHRGASADRPEGTLCALRQAIEVGADIVEIHTGIFAEATDPDEIQREFEKVRVAAIAATEMGLKAHGGHGLTYRNVQAIAEIGEIVEVSIGHSIVSRAVLVGMDLAVREMLVLLEAPE